MIHPATLHYVQGKQDFLRENKKLALTNAVRKGAPPKPYGED